MARSYLQRAFQEEAQPEGPWFASSQLSLFSQHSARHLKASDSEAVSRDAFSVLPGGLDLSVHSACLLVAGPLSSTI